MERYIEQGCFEACSFDFNVQTCFVVQSLQYFDIVYIILPTK